jgi:flagellar biosynthetic protein FliR
MLSNLDVATAGLPTAEQFIFGFYIFMRMTGLVLVAPLFSSRIINPSIRVYIAVFLTLILAMTLYPNYFGPASRYHLDSLDGLNQRDAFGIVWNGMIELGIGYLIGFCFNVVFESMILAGELIDSMIGFSAAQFIDPFAFGFQSLLGQLLVIAGVIFMLITDFHHVFIKLIANSLLMVPLGNYVFNPSYTQDVVTGTSWIFIFAVKFCAIPLIVLSCMLVGIAFTVRVLPEMNLLLTGLPMRILMGLFTVALTVGRLPPLFEESFNAVTRLAETIIYHLQAVL